MVDLIPPLSKGKLSQFGYSASKGAQSRHNALDKAIRQYGVTSVARKLTAVSTLQKHTNPPVSAIFKKDQQYVMSQKPTKVAKRV
jgi:hypothetical protein